MKIKSSPILISIILPIYNAETFLSETIESILSQTFTLFELIALDDGSTDHSKKIILSYKDHRIKYIYCQHNFINTLNIGLNLAKGKYIALIDHDDIMMPYRLQTQFDFMGKNTNVAACGGYMHSFGIESSPMMVPLLHNEIIERMLLACSILNPTGFIRKNILDEYNIVYCNGYSFAADFKMWVDIAKVGKVENIPKVLTLYRTSDNQTSRKYRQDCLPADMKIKMEALEHFFSNLKDKNEYSKMIDEEVIPLFHKLDDFNCFSHFTFFLFLYELIKHFRKMGVITV